MSRGWVLAAALVVVAFTLPPPAPGVAGGVEEPSDSIEAVEEALVDIDPGEQPVPEPLSEPAARRRADVTVVGGERSQTRARLWLGPFAAGLRADNASRQWYVRFGGRGFVREVVVGNQRTQVGERVVFGRNFGSYPSSARGPVAGGFRTSPSLSRYFARPAVSVVLAAGRLSSHCVLAPPNDDRSGWMLSSIISSTGRLAVGITAAARVHPEGDAAGGMQISHPEIVSLHGDWRRPEGRLSFEIVRHANGRLFGGLRANGRTQAPWSLLLFRVPGSSSLPDDTGTTANERFGCLLEARRLVRRCMYSAALETVSLVRSNERRLTRRIRAGWTLRRKTVTWEMSGRFRHDAGTRWPQSALAEGVRVSSVWRSRTRTALRIRSGSWSHVILVEYFPGRFRAGDGVLFSVGSSVSAGRLEMAWRLSAHDVPAGRAGFISRPGIGTYEFFSSVYGRGSDVSLRARLALSRAIRFEVYAGTPWEKPARVYMAARIRL